MSTMQRIGLPLAFCAALVLIMPGCGSTEELWIADTVVEEEALGPMKVEETAVAGRLHLTVTQKVHRTETPLERLSLRHTETYTEFDWDTFGLTFFSILGGIVSIGLYFLFAFVIFDPTPDEEN